MKFISILISFALIILVQKNMANKEEKSNLTLMDVLQNILNDPEFLALNDKQQLRVLIMIYNYLENFYKAEENTKLRLKRDLKVDE